MKKKTFFIILILFLNCGFTSIEAKPEKTPLDPILIPRDRIISIKKPSLKLLDTDENFLSLEYLTDDVQIVSVENNKKIWQGTNQRVLLYELFEDDRFEYGVEFEFLLLEYPHPSNTLTFKIDSEGLDFYYQPSLDKEILREDWNVNETHAFDENGTLKVYRPIDVVDSYAVYDELTQQKKMHIYRIKLIDAIQNVTYGTMRIFKDSGIMKIKLPEEYLQNAHYPVLVDPTFGYTSIGGTTDDNPWGNNKVAWRFTNNAGNGNVTQLSIYGRAVDTTGDMRAALYANNASNYPSDLLQQSNAVSVTTTARWWNFTVNQEVDLSERYWISIQRNAGANNFRNYYDAGLANQAVQEADAYADGFSDPFGDPDWTYNRRGSAFATMTLISEPSYYGENETALGQFVDNFEDLGNVSVQSLVTRNASLNAMELNWTSGVLVTPYQNFTDTFSLTDPNNRLTLYDFNITALNSARGDESRATEDYGVGALDEPFTFHFDWNITEINIGDGTQRRVVHLVVLNLNNIKAVSNDELQINIEQLVAEDNTKYDIGFVQRDGGVDVIDKTMTTEFNVSQEYYGVLQRSTATFKNFSVYSDSARTDLIEVVNSTSGTDDFRFWQFFKQNEAAQDATDDFNGTVSNLWNTSIPQTGGEGYASEGYFSTVDYLSDPLANGSTLVYQTITTIPPNTEITVQFSSNNSTWVDSEGVAGHETLSGGLESIELRGLNYTSGFYAMGNLSTSDSSITPLFNQSKLITTEGNQTGAAAAPSVGGSGGIGFFMLILILTPVLLILVWSRRR